MHSRGSLVVGARTAHAGQSPHPDKSTSVDITVLPDGMGKPAPHAGVVASQADKDLAGISANGVSGAFSVTNSLHIEAKK